MPAPHHITLTLNARRTELVEHGWGLTRSAANVNLAELLEVEGTDPTEFEYQLAGVPAGLWREPNSGVFMLSPSILDLEEVEDPNYDSDHFDASQLEVAKWSDGSPLALWVSRSSSRAAVPSKALISRPSGVLPSLSLIELLNTIAIEALLVRLVGMHHIARSREPLQMNEGWSCLIDAYGVSSDRATTLISFYFGAYWAISIHLNGTMRFYENVSTKPDLEPIWAWRETFNYRQGGVDHVTPFRVTVIPWGARYISIIFTQDASVGSGFLGLAHVPNARRSAFLIDVERFDRELEWHGNQQMWEITKAAHVHVFADPEVHKFAFDLSRVRYKSQATMTPMPEFFGHPRGQPVEIEYYGFEGHRDGVYATGTDIVIGDIKNKSGAEFLPDEDETVTADITFKPSLNAVYTPELWGLIYSIPTTTHTPDWEEYDASAEWANLRFQMTSGLEACSLEGRLHRPITSFGDHYKLGTPIRITAKTEDESQTVVLFEGYTSERNPTHHGFVTNTSTLLSLDELFAIDLWDRLDNLPIGYMESIENLSLGQLFRKGLDRAGFLDAEIDVESELDSLMIDFGNDQSNLLRHVNEDTKVGDLFREIGGRFGFQNRTPIRCRRHWTGSDVVWKVGLAPIWDRDEMAVTKLFYLDPSIVPSFGGAVRSDVQRWNPSLAFGSEQHFLVKDWEPTVRRPDCNAAVFTMTDGVSSKGQREVFDIPPDPRVLDDPTVWMFEGAMRVKEYGPPEITAQSFEELQRQGRFLYEQIYTGLLRCSMQAEWQPGMQCDDLLAVVGRAPAAGPGFLKGDPISYGVYRIQSIDVEMRADWENARYEWSGNYSIYYVGRTPDGFPYPMFTDAEKLPAVPAFS